MKLKNKPFENIVGKGENAGNSIFSFFPHCTQSMTKIILDNIILKSANAPSLDQSRILLFGKEVNENTVRFTYYEIGFNEVTLTTYMLSNPCRIPGFWFFFSFYTV